MGRLQVPETRVTISRIPHAPLDLAALPPSRVELERVPLILGRLCDHPDQKGTAEGRGCDFQGFGTLVPGIQPPCSEEAQAACESPTWRGPKVPRPVALAALSATWGAASSWKWVLQPSNRPCLALSPGRRLNK